MIRPKKLPRDTNQRAHEVARLLIEGTEPASGKQKNPAAVTLGRLGGLKGGKARAAKLSAIERREAAKKAARARWAAHRA